MAVAGEAQIQTKRGEVVVLRDEVERAREAQAPLVAIERHAFDGLENPREMHRRAAHLRGDLGERPAPRGIAREDELGAIDKALVARTPVGFMGWARSQRTPHQWEGEAP